MDYEWWQWCLTHSMRMFDGSELWIVAVPSPPCQMQNADQNRVSHVCNWIFAMPVGRGLSDAVIYSRLFSFGQFYAVIARFSLQNKFVHANMRHGAKIIEDGWLEWTLVKNFHPRSAKWPKWAIPARLRVAWGEVAILAIWSVILAHIPKIVDIDRLAMDTHSQAVCKALRVCFSLYTHQKWCTTLACNFEKMRKNWVCWGDLLC